MDKTTASFLLGLVTDRPCVPRGLDWARALDATGELRLAGLAFAAAGRPSFRDVPRHVLGAWESSFRAQALAGALLLEELAVVRGTLGEAGIRMGVIKGGQLLASGVYEPGARALDDLDLVVPRHAAREAAERLAAAGWRPWSDDVACAVAWTTGATFEPRGPARFLGLSVDLHGGGDYGALRPGCRASWWEDPDRWDGRGWLGPEDHLVLIVEHLLKHLRRGVHLVGLADAARLVARVADWGRLADTLSRSRWRAAGWAVVTGLAVASAVQIPDGAAPRLRNSLVRQLDPRRLVRRAGWTVGRARGLGSRWNLLGPVPAVREVVDVTLPPGAWLERRYPGRRTRGRRRMRHLTRLVRWGLGAGASPLAPNQDPPSASSGPSAGGPRRRRPGSGREPWLAVRP